MTEASAPRRRAEARHGATDPWVPMRPGPAAALCRLSCTAASRSCGGCCCGGGRPRVVLRTDVVRNETV